MSNLLAQYNQQNLARVQKEIPSFRAGDTLKVEVLIFDGNNQRTQAFEGVCIARRNSGIGSSFTVRKISQGQGIEKTFLLYSPTVSKISVLRRGKVRRAKLYYLRELKGKAARIKELPNFGKTKAAL